MGNDLEVGLMPGFHTAPGGGVSLVLEADESVLLRRLAAELRAVIEQGVTDPVTERLFPAAYEDPSEEEAYRDLVGDDLSREKLRALDTLVTALPDRGGTVTLTADDLSTWLACLTDLRLAIGTRLEVDETRMASGIDPRDPDAPAFSVLHWLGFVQEGILRTVESDGRGPITT